MFKRKRLAIVYFVFASFAALHISAASVASSNYDDLVALFNEFREYQEPPISKGIPDYSAAAIEKNYSDLKVFQKRLAALDINDWPVWQKVDYHLVRAEMNAVYFHHRVLKPWERNPCFYSMSQGDTGPSVNLRRYVSPLFDVELPFTQEDQLQFQKILQGIPGLYKQAQSNLTNAAGDFAELALHFNRRDAQLFDRIVQRLEEHHPQLAASAKSAGEAVSGYFNWLEQNKHTMTASAGVGKDNFSWWMRNVQLMPWGWDESNAIIQREYDRIITFLKLEEHRNRKLPPLKVAMSQKEWDDSLKQALHYVVDFLRDEEIMTIPDWVNPKDYYGRREAEADKEGYDAPNERFLPQNTDVDMKYRQREILPGETHEYVGHMLDYQRQQRQTKSPIRQAGRRYNMGSLRTEGWAVALEELLMQVGVLDERPRRGRIMEYIMNASHMSLAIPDMKMHSNEINLAEARSLCAEIMPWGWTREDEPVVWFEMKSNIGNPGGFHSNVVTGKAYFMKIFRECAQELDTEFVLKNFIDKFLDSGIIPMPLIRWEMTGKYDDIALETETLPGTDPDYLSSSQEKLAITHGPYLIDPAENAMTVVWFTNKKCVSWVEYSDDKNFRTFPTWGGYPKVAKSSNNGLIDANNKRHIIRIKNLEKGMKYKYRIVSKEILQFDPYEVLYGDTVVGEVHEFQTLDSGKDSFSFGAVTDVHERGSELDGLLKNAEVNALDLMFYTGDILNWIGDEKRIFNGFIDVSVKHFAKEKPFILIRGNHEARGPNARKLRSYFPHSSGKFYYSFTQGDVFFIILDAGEDKPDTHPVYASLVDFDAYRNEQAEWLQKQVESKGFKQSLYKVVLVHIPLFSGSTKHGATDLTKKIGPILNKAGIDLMISGHHHRFDIIQNNENGNHFPVVIIGQDMFLKTDVSEEGLSISITNKDGVVVDNFSVKGKKERDPY